MPYILNKCENTNYIYGEKTEVFGPVLIVRYLRTKSSTEFNFKTIPGLELFFKKN